MPVGEDFTVVGAKYVSERSFGSEEGDLSSLRSRSGHSSRRQIHRA